MSTELDSHERALHCVRYALDKKAYDLVLLEVGKLTALSDYFLICTGRSDTQVQAIAQSIEENLGREGIRPLSIEGYTHGQWVVMDYDDVIVHIFYEPVREFYDLERLWSKATRVDLPEPYESQARDLRLAGEAR
ncbi:MAG TPA: ribosome silencing factor [Terriglobales bacterium]|nr:ribosome silencing factor [Terriglobales bacterium]